MPRGVARRRAMAEMPETRGLLSGRSRAPGGLALAHGPPPGSGTGPAQAPRQRRRRLGEADRSGRRAGWARIPTSRRPRARRRPRLSRLVFPPNRTRVERAKSPSDSVFALCIAAEMGYIVGTLVGYGENK